MNSIVAFLGSVSVVCALSNSAVARPQAVFELDKVVRVSDIVVVVDVLGIQQAGTSEKIINGTAFSCNRIVATCKVLEVFKGQDIKSPKITVEFQQGKDVPLGMEELRQGENSVLFLKRVRSEHFIFADDQCSKIPLDAFVPSITRSEGSLRENIGRQLVANLEDKNAKMVENAIYWANIIGYPMPEEALGRLSESTNLNMAIVALVPFVQQGKKPAIMRAVNILLGAYQGDRNGIETLAWALEGSAKSVSVDQANKLAISGVAMISRIGMRILRTVGDESSVAVLLGGLDAEDKDAQYSAVVGLCRVTGQRGPSLREFMQNRDAEVMKWQRWGKEKGSSGSAPEIGLSNK